VSTPWAVQLPRSSARAAGALRLRPDVRVVEIGATLWLRGNNLDEALDVELRKLPGARRFTVNPDDTVTEIGRRLPADDLPTDPWLPLFEWLTPQPQPAALSGEVGDRVPLRLERTGAEHAATALLTTAGTFAAYASTAPAVRLRPLRFAAASDGRVVLWGSPLPPLPGRRFTDTDGVAVPCGFAWAPAVEPAMLCQLLQLGPGDLALFHEDASHERIDAASFARATRAAARATGEALQPGGTGGG
jgi:hypothetical protein